jgi:predicted PurR-regulated permease PerM
MWTLYLCRHVLLLVYVSILLAAGMSPLVRAIERQRVLPVGGRVPHWLAIGVLYAIIVGTLVGLGFALLPAVVTQGQELAASMPMLLGRIEGFVASYGIPIRIPSSAGEALEQVNLDGATTIGTMLTTITGVLGGVFGAITILILTFYLLIESRTLLRNFVRLVPARHRPDVEAVTRQVVLKTSGWLNGQLLLAVIIGGTSALGLWLLGVPYFYVVAAVSAVAELLPYIGPLFSAAFGISIALATSSELAVWVGVFFLVQQQLENHILVPKLMGHQVGLSSALVIIAVLVGGALLGIVGMILAVPTAAIVQVIVDELRGETPPTPASS